MKYDIRIETCLLGAIISKNEIYDSISLKPADFSIEKNQRIFKAMGEILEEKNKIDYITLNDKLKGKVEIDYISRLDDFSIGNIEFYQNNIREESQRKKLKVISDEIQSKLIKGEDVEDIINDTDKLLTGINDVNQNYKNMKEVFIKHLEVLEARCTGNVKKEIETGYGLLDYIMGGLLKQTLTIIGARTSIGKTQFMLNLVSNISKNYKVGIFSLEMNERLILDRFIAINTGIELKALKKGTFKQSDFTHLVNVGNLLNERTILIDDTPNLNLNILKAKTRKMKRDGAQIIFIDYITLIEFKDNFMKRPERVGYIGKSLKQLAREIDLPIVILSQVGRSAEDRMPSLSELRDSGELEEDSDIVIFFHRKRDSEDGIIRVAKNRNDGIGDVQVHFNLANGLIREINNT